MLDTTALMFLVTGVFYFLFVHAVDFKQIPQVHFIKCLFLFFLFFFFLIDGNQRNLYKKDTYVLKSEQEVLKESARKDHIKYRIFFTQW